MVENYFLFFFSHFITFRQINGVTYPWKQFWYEYIFLYVKFWKPISFLFIQIIFWIIFFIQTFRNIQYVISSLLLVNKLFIFCFVVGKTWVCAVLVLKVLNNICKAPPLNLHNSSCGWSHFWCLKLWFFEYIHQK